MKEATHILIVEDKQADAELAKYTIQKVLNDCEFQIVETRQDFLNVLEIFRPDVILSDYSLPRFDGMKALKLALEHAPLTPLIIWTGSISEDVAVECMKAGANNYILKENTKRLGPAVIHALEERQLLLERKQAEEAHQNSEKRFHALIENGLDDISLLAADGTLLWESPSIVRNLGYPPDTFVGHNIFELMHPDDLEWTQRLYQGLVQEAGSREQGEFRLHRADGTWRWVEAIATNMLNEPSVNAIVINYRDVTERKQAEEALQDSERRFRALIENGSDSISLLAADGTLIWESPSAIRLLDYAPDEYLGQNIFTLMHPDDLKWTQDMYTKLVQEPGGHERGTFRLRHSDGTWRWVEAIVTNMLSEPSVNAIVVNYRDITERRQAEERLRQSENRYRLATKATNDVIWEWNPKTNQLLWSENAQHVFGYPPEEIGPEEKWWDDHIHPDDRERVLSKLNALIAGHASIWTEEYRFLLKNGSYAHISDHAYVERDATGKPLRMIGAMANVTERKQSEEALRQSEARYRSLVEAQTEFIVRWRPDGTRTFANEAYCRYFGLTPEQAVSASFIPLVHEQDRQAVEDKISRLISGVTNIETDIHRVIKPDGSIGWQEWTDQTLYDDDGQLLELQSVGRDVTERKRAEEALRESENRLILALAGAQMSVWEWNLQTNAIFWSPELFEITGITRGDLDETFESFTNLIHQEDVNRVRVSAEKALADQSLFAEEFRIIRPDGKIRWLSNLGHAEYDSEHKNVRLIGTIQDITQRKQAEIERQALLEIMQGLANTKDLEELLKLVHHSIAKVIYAENLFVVLYQQDSGLFEEIYSVDQYDPPAPPSKLEKSITSYIFRSGEPLLLTQDRFNELVAQGEVILVGTNSESWLGVPLKTSGKTIGVIAVQDYERPNIYSERERDFLASIATQVALAIERKQAEEALRESEEHYRTIFESVQDAIFVESMDGKILMVNERACEMFGYSQAEFLTKRVTDIVPPGHLVWMGDGKDVSLSDEPRETINQRANGEAFPVEISGRLQEINGETVLLVVVRDISERKQAEKALEENEKRFRALIENSSEVIATVQADGIITYVTPGISDVLGYSVDEYAGRNGLEFIHQEDIKGSVEILEEALRRPGIAFKTLVRERHKDGSWRWLEGSITNLLDESSVKALVVNFHDISERKQAEEALHKSEALYRQAIEVAGAVPYLEAYYDEGRLIKYEFIGEGIRQITGYGPEEFSATVWDSLVEEVNLVEDLAGYSLDEGIQRVRTGKNSIWKCEHRLRARDGKIHWVLEAAVELRDENGVSHGSIGTYQDITTRKQAEEALRNSESKYRALAENSQQGIAIYQGQKIVYANPAMCQINGYTAEELMDMSADQIIALTHPDDRAVARERVIKRIAGETLSPGFEGRILRKDGTIAWIQSFNNPIEYDGKPALLSTMIDVTERKQAEEELRASEERFRQLADNIQEAFWMTDAESGEEIYLSSAAESIWERTTESLMHEPNTFINSVFPADQPAVLQAIEKEKRGEKVEIEYRIVRPNGTVRWVWDRAFPIFDDTGKVKRIAGISADITERRESEIALVKSQSRYRELFDSSPVSIWEEDYSLVKRQIDLLLESGVMDLKEYLSTHPDKVMELASLVRITDANKAALELYDIEEKDIVLKELTQILSRDALSHFQEEILGFLSPSKRFIWEGTDKMVNGTQVEVIVNGSIPHGYEEDWSKVIISISDITERKRAEEEIRRGAEETSALLETSLALTNLDLKATLETISNSAKTLFVADGCRIFLVEPDGESLRCVLALQENSAAFANLRIRIGEGVTGAVAASGQAEIINEMQNDPRAVQVPGTQEMEEEAIMFAPLKERDHTIGVLSIRRAGSERPFQPAELELLEAFASMAASAVSNARLFEETQRRLTELEALYENGLAVGRLLKTNEIGNRMINTFAHYLQWHHVTIRLRKEESDDLDLVAFNLPDLKEEERAKAKQHFVALVKKVGQGLSGWAIQTGAPIRTGNVYAHPQYVDTHAGIHSGLYMPLTVGGRVIGVISVESETPDAFTEQDERLLATLANQAAIAFENARLYEAIQKELSERKRAEEDLRASEVHYRELADSITDILFELDQDLHYTHWNKASEMLTGVSAKDAIGKSMHEIFGESEEQTRISQIYEGVLKDRRPRTFETALLPNGQKRSFEINAYPSTRGLSVVAKDVTERKRSEIIMQKRFELMEFSAHHSLDELMQKTIDEVSELTGSSIGFLHFVDDDQITLGMQTWSTNALQLFHVPAREGEHLPLDQAGVWAEAARQRRPLIQNDYESSARRKSLPQGHVPITRELVIPIIRNERIMAVMGIGNKTQDYTQHDLEIAARLADYAWDVTERKQMELALEAERNQLAQRVDERTADLSRANSNLARALRVKDEFLANMSHELRTPLNAILGLSESLSEQIAGPLNEKQQKYISTISESGHHLLSLINDILDLAKIDAGQITLDINKVDIHSVCQASLRMIKQLAQKKHQEVSLEIDDGLGVMWADERRLKQMLVNLLGNAVKFTPENGTLGLEVHGDEEANKISFTVWDKGLGIKEEDLARLFQPFVQLDSGLARETTGTGLGLALVAQMVRLHGGSIQAASEPENGSRFTIVLPWEPALAMDAATRMKVTGKFRAIKLDEKNKSTILLVEDTKEVTMMIKDYLELAGYKVVTAQDGVDAIVQAKLVRPDLILMDVQMPRMDGLEATRKLRSEPDFRYTPIIALTALAMSGDREQCLEAGMDEYISKPVNLKALIKIIQGCLFSNQEVKSQ